MGIKGLNQLLKKICGCSHITNVPISSYSGKTIAIDAALYLCVFKSRNNYKKSIIDFIVTLRQNNINPYFVFDGHSPDEKKQERHERAEKRSSARERVKRLEEELENFIKTGELTKSLQDIDQKIRRKIIIKRTTSPDMFRQYIEKLKSQQFSVSKEDFEIMKGILEAFSVPYTTAEGEGEFHCSELVKLGKAEAVMTADTDVLACLAPTVIKGIDSVNFHIVHLDKILECLNLTSEEFLDFCIMCGTDFNRNIPNIGPVRSYELIKKFKSIDNLPKEINKMCLSHEKVRGIFKAKPVLTEEIKKCGDVNYDKLAVYTQDIEEIKKRMNQK